MMGGGPGARNPQENEDTLTNESSAQQQSNNPAENENNPPPQQPNPMSGMFPGMQGMNFNDIMNAYGFIFLII